MISDVIRNTTRQMLNKAQEQTLTPELFRLGCESLLRAAEQVERIERSVVPEHLRGEDAGDEAGDDATVVDLDEERQRRRGWPGLPVKPGGGAA